MDEQFMTYQTAIAHLERIMLETQNGSLHLNNIRQRTEELLAVARFLKNYFEQQRSSLQQAAFNLSFSGSTIWNKPGATSSLQISKAETPSKPGEKRRHQRIGLILSVEMSIEGYKIAGRITDLSEGGFFVDTLTIFGEGTPVKFHFTVDGGRVEGEGVVRTSIDQFGMGIEITAISDTHAELLSDYLKKQE